MGGALRRALDVDRASTRHLRCFREEHHLTVTARTARSETPVIELARVRDARRLDGCRRRTQQVLDGNKGALSRLFNSGVVYSRVGTRLARELLLAHQNLLRAAELLARLAELEGREPVDVDEVLDEVEALLARSSGLTARSEVVLARR